MLRRSIALASVGLLAAVPGCEEAPRAGPRGETRVEVRLPSGTTVSVDPGSSVTEISRDGRFGWELPDGTRVLLQTTATDEEPGSVDRTPAAVAAALAERLELGEAEGELAHHECTAGAVRGECVIGWQVDSDGDRWTRRGFVFDAHGEVLWLDVTTPDASSDTFEHRAETIRESLRVEPSR